MSNAFPRLVLLSFIAAFQSGVTPVCVAAFRPPAVPLVTFDPYLSVWSRADRLTDSVTTHWTRHPHPLLSMIRVDGKAFRLMGDEPVSVTALPQQSVSVLPTRTIYEFENSTVHVTLTFMTAALPNDLEAFSQPLSYVTWQVRSVDGATHAVQLYDSTSSLLAVNDNAQPVKWGRESAGDLTVLHAGTAEQPVLRRAGDDTRIDWGYVYVAAPANQMSAVVGAGPAVGASFVQSGSLPASDDAQMPARPTMTSPCSQLHPIWEVLAQLPFHAPWSSPMTRFTRSSTSASRCGPTGAATAPRRTTC